MSKSFVTSVLEPVKAHIVGDGDRSSFFINGSYHTYKEFGQCISKMRCAIQDAGVEQQIVGLAIHDDIDTYATIFALWMEGKAYVPLHPNQPLERNLGIITQSKLKCIIDSSSDSIYGGIVKSLICTLSLSYENDCLDSIKEIPESNLAYVLFTSGSTGVPKGVMVSRHNLASFVESFSEVYKIDADDKCLQCFDLCFDFSVVSYLIPLVAGACVFTTTYGGLKYLQIASLLVNHGLTIMPMTPSVVKYLKPFFGELNCSSVRYSFFCGESLPESLVNDWAGCASFSIIDNFYGPTEATVFSSIYRYRKNEYNKTYNGILSIGKSLSGCRMAIFDDNCVLDIGNKIGELCLAGDQLCSGYLGNEEKNEKSFFMRDGFRWYKTGDLCMQDSDGYYFYLSRIDQQAKIQGFRVELGEIEFNARTFLKDRNVVCLAFDNAQGLTEIAMFIESEQFDTGEMMSYLRSKMPSYMIPTRVLFEPVFPLNKSEKVDRVKLKAKLTD